MLSDLINKMKNLGEYEPYLTTLLSLVAPETKLTAEPSLKEVMASENKLVVVLNHAAPLSWVPAASLLTREAVRAGAGNRIPRGIIDQFFYQFTPLKPVAKFVTQSDEFLNFDQLVEHFENAPQADLVIFPEGSNCFFGRPSEIQKFRSPRFIEIAVRTNVPILICTHSGSEIWGQPFKFPPSFSAIIPFLPPWAQKGIASTGMATMPTFPVPLEDFRMHCELYRPKLRASDLFEDKHERRAQLHEEAEHVRSIMMITLASLQDEIRENANRVRQAKLDTL